MQRPSSLRIGTRQSPLALAQTEIVRRRLGDAFAGLKTEIVPLLTSGDRHKDQSLADIGGKALFTKELEESLEAGQVDIAVHSLKDMETYLRPGMIIGAVLERADPRDVLIAPQAKTLEALPTGARIGTSSLRRAAQMKMLRPDITIIPFRGNVATRITKLKNGEADAILLALAGLERIGLAHEATEILSAERFVPAVGQGAIAVECSAKNAEVCAMLQQINHPSSFQASLAERSMLAVLNGSCRTPVGGYARVSGDELQLDALLAMPDGSLHLRAAHKGKAKDAVQIGETVAKDLLARGGAKCLG